MKIVELTDQEIAVNRSLINTALKTIGIQAAEVALLLDRKLAMATDAPEPPSEPKAEASE